MQEGALEAPPEEKCVAVFSELYREFRPRARGPADLVPWKQLAAPGVILNKTNHALQRTWIVRGQDLTGDTLETQGAKMLQANNVLKRLGGKWMLHSEAQRVRWHDYPFSTSHYPIAAMIDAERRRMLVDDPGSRETRYYLTLTWTPPTAVSHASRRLFLKGLPPENDATLYEAKTLADFLTQTEYFIGLLRGVLAVCEPADTDTMLTYLHTCVSDRWHPVRCPGDVLGIDEKLCDTPLITGWYPQLGRWHLRTCSIKGYPAMSMVGIVKALEAADLDYRWVTRWIGMERNVQAGILRRTQGAWVHSERSFGARIAENWSGEKARIQDSDAANKAIQADAARQELGADIVAYGNFTSTVTVWDADPERADQKRSLVMQCFEQRGFTMVKEEEHAIPAWLSSLPGNRMDSVRRTPQHSLTLAHLLPGLSAAWGGPMWDSHLKAGPWFYAHTDTSTIFRVINHVSDVGHFLVLGPTRSGKSVFAAFSVAQWLHRYRNSQVFWFDVDRSARLLTLLLGGHWYDLAGGQLAFQPLRHIDETQEQAWAQSWLLQLCRQAGVPERVEVQQYIGAGLRELAKRPPQQRTLSTLITLMADHSRQVELQAKAGRIDAQGISHADRRLEDLVSAHVAVRNVLKIYAKGGTYGWLLDADHDDLQDGPLHTFEQRALLQMPDLVGPVTSYLFHRLEQRFSTDTPTYIPTDEAAITWALPDFEKKGKEWLMTTAKKSVSLGFFTHSLSQVFESKLGPLLLESCPTRYFLPNPSAKAPQMAAIYDRLGLTPEEITLIATAQPQRDFYYSCELLGKRLFHLNLSEDILRCIARNEAHHHEQMDWILEQYGVEGFAEAWLRGNESRARDESRASTRTSLDRRGGGGRDDDYPFTNGLRGDRTDECLPARSL